MRFYEDPKPLKDMSREEMIEFFAKSQESYHYFSEVVMGYYDMNEVHRQLCQFLQDEEQKYKMCLLPRLTFKSTIVTQGYTLWKIQKNPNARILIYSDSIVKAQGFLRGIKNHIEGRAGRSRWRSHFGDWKSELTWNENQIIVNKRNMGSVEPTVDTSGIESSRVGMHYDLIIFDDIVSDVNVTNKQQMDKVYECYQRSLSLLTRNGEIVLVGCLVKDSKVKMADNTYKDIIDIKPGDYVASYDDGKIVSQEVEAMIPQGTAKVYELKTANNTIRATSNHPFLTENRGFVKLKDLTSEDRITCSAYHPSHDESSSADDMWLLGFWFGDGWITHHPNSKGSMRWVTCFAYGIDETLNKKVCSFLENKFNFKFKKTRFGYYRTEVARVGKWLESLGFEGKAKTKRIPEYIYTLPVKYRLAFLNGFIDADGHIDKCISIEICNKELIKDIKLLAESCGFRVSNIYSRQRISQPPHSPRPIVSQSHHISMGLKPSRKQEIYFSKISSITLAGEEEVYDLTVANTHNFIAESFIVHNTRWHFADMYGKLIAENNETKLFKFFIKDAEETRDDGTLIFDDIGEQALTRKHLDRLKEQQGNYIFSCLYRNNPVDSEDALFKSQNFRFYGRLKKSEKPLQHGLYDKLFITGALDPAGQGKDRTGGTVCGTDNDMKIHVLDVLSKHLMPGQMIDWIIEMNRMYKFKLFGVETKLFQGMLRAELEKRMKEEQKKDPYFNNFGIREFKPSKGETKFIRISALQPWHERGDILFPGNSLHTLKAGFSDLAFQMMQVTSNHMPEPNDILDSLQMHLSMVQAGGVVQKEELPENSPAWIEKKWIEDWNRKQRRLPRRMRKTYRPRLS